MKKNQCVKGFCLAAAILFCLLTISSEAAAAPEYVIKLSHEVPENSLQDLFAKHFKKIVEEKTHGDVQIKIFISNQLGDPRSVLEGVQMGNIGLAVINAGSVATVLKDLAIFNIPVLLPAEMDKVKTIFAGKALPAIAKNAEKTGLKYLCAFAGPYLQLTSSNRKIASPEDLKGFKIGVNSYFNLHAYRALGANPMILPFSDLYPCLQRNIVDGQENSYDIIYDMHFYEVQKYFTASNHVRSVDFMWMSAGIFNKLPKEYREIVVEAGKTAQDQIFDLVPEIKNKMRNKLLKKGMIEVNPVPELRAAFVRARSVKEKIYIKYVEDGQRNLKIIHDAVNKVLDN